MEQLIESLIAAGVDRTRIERARRRGIAYQCLRCYYKDGSKVLNIKCRTEDHIMRVHLGRDELPFYCKLCAFRCTKREQLYEHVTAYSRPVHLAVKSNVVDHSPFLVENSKPHIFGPLDYKAHTPEASLLHWLGVVDGEQTTVDIGTALAATTSTIATGRGPLMSSAMSTFVTSAPPSTPQTKSLPSVQSTLPPVVSQTVWSPWMTQQPLPSLSAQDVAQELSGGLQLAPSLPALSGLDHPDVANQLTAILQTIAAGIVQKPMEPNLGDGLPTHTTSALETTQPQQDVGTENVTVEWSEKVVDTGRKLSNQASGLVLPLETGQEEEIGEAETGDDSEEDDGNPEAPQYIPTAIQRTSSRTEEENPIPAEREEDVLSLADENMSLSTSVKRGREEEDKATEAKRAKEDRAEVLPVNTADLSEKTLVEIVGVAQKVAERNLAVSERMAEAMVETSCMLGKLTDAVTRLRSTIEEHDKEERRRVDRRRELEMRREEEWRREWNRRRDGERRWEERRRDWERRDKEERRKEDERRAEEDTKDVDKTEKENNQRPRSVLGRVYTKTALLKESGRIKS